MSLVSTSHPPIQPADVDRLSPCPGRSLRRSQVQFGIDHDLELGPAASIGVDTRRDNRPVDVAARGGLAYVLSVGDTAPPTAGDHRAAVRAVDAAGDVVWEWWSAKSSDRPQDLFAPAAGSAVYVSGQVTVEVIPSAGYVARIDDGVELWRQERPAHFESRIALAGSADGARLYALAGKVGPWEAQQNLAALDPTTGTPLWTVALPTFLEPKDFACDDAGDQVVVLFEGTGTVSDALFVYAGATGVLERTIELAPFVGQAQTRALALTPDGTRAFVALSSNPTGVTAFDLLSGEHLWNAELPGNAAPAALVFEPTGPNLFVLSSQSSTSGAIHAVVPLTGQLQWTAPLAAAPGAAVQQLRMTLLGALPVVSSATIGSLYEVTAFHPVDGDIVWATSATGSMTTNQLSHVRLGTVADARVLFLAPEASLDSSLDVHLRAFGGDQGALVWQDDYGATGVVPDPRDLVLPAGSDRVFGVVAHASGRGLFAVSRQSGDLSWVVELDSAPPLSTNSYARGARLAASENGDIVLAARRFNAQGQGRIEAFDGASGAALWSHLFPLVTQEVDDLQIHGERAFVQHRAQPALSVFDVSTGNLLWQASPSNSQFAGGMVVDVVANRVYVQRWSGVFTSQLLAFRLPNGVELWNKPLPATDFGLEPAAGLFRPLDLQAGPGGDVLALGQFPGNGTIPPTIGVARLNGVAGASQWTRTVALDDIQFGDQGHVLHAPAVGAAVAAVAAFDGSRSVVQTAGFATENGSLLWSKVLGSAGDPVELLDAVVDPTGRAVILSIARPQGETEALAFDALTGTPLYTATVATGSGADRLGALGVVDGEIWGLVGFDDFAPGGEVHVVSFEQKSLVSGPEAVSLAAPEAVVFLLDRPASSAGSTYWVLGSFSGSSPALPLDVVELPLVVDPYFLLTLSAPNSPPLEATLGVLDAAGDGRARLVLPSGLAPILAGATLHHAFVEVTPQGALVFASQALAVELVP